MGLTMKEKRAVTREVAKRYQGARKKEKGRMYFQWQWPLDWRRKSKHLFPFWKTYEE